MSGRVVVAGAVAIERIVRYAEPALPTDPRTAETLALAIGGPGAIAAVAAAAAGGDVACAAAVGTDPAGAVIRQRLARADVDVRAVTPRPGESARLLRPVAVPGPGTGGSAPGPTRPPGPLLLPGVGWGPGSAAPAEVLGACAPGDVLLLDAVALAGARPLVEAAYARDLQILALLTPYAHGLPVDAAEGVDVVVADQSAAAAMADAGFLPPSLCVVVGTAGLSWDGATFLAEAAGPAPAADAAEHAYAVLAGTLAARLARGDDRPEAASAALAAARAAGARAIPYPDLRLHEEDLG